MNPKLGRNGYEYRSLTSCRVPLLILALSCLAPDVPLKSQTLTEAYVFSSDVGGSESGSQFWNSDGGVFNLYVAEGTPFGNPDGLVGNLSSPINFLLHAGRN